MKMNFNKGQAKLAQGEIVTVVGTASQRRGHLLVEGKTGKLKKFECKLKSIDLKIIYRHYDKRSFSIS